MTVDDELRKRIGANLLEVNERLHEACNRAERPREKVTLIAITKTATPDQVRVLYDLGVRDFGENRVADGLKQVAALGAGDAVWHLVGHLQRNKAADAIIGFRSIHSVESGLLVQVLQRESVRQDVRVGALIEVNVSGEVGKYGVAPDGLPGLIETVLGCDRISLCGLMAMAPFTDNPETARPVFRTLRQLRDDMERRFSISLPDLSMGMSGDYEVAVEEGATLVRIGAALLK